MPEILRSWKEIAQYTGTSVRTLQRWEKEFHLPIRRLVTKKGSVVFAFCSDLDTWFRVRTQTAEMAVRDEHFRMMFMNSALPSMVLDNSRKILDVNDALCQLLGLERTRFLGRMTDGFSQYTMEYDEKEWKYFLQAGASIGQRNVRHFNGALLGVEYVLKNIYPGLNVATVVATHPGGIPENQVYYRLGRGTLSV